MNDINRHFDGPGPDSTYSSFLKKQVFALPKCLDCGEFHFFPRVVCPHCGGFNLEWKPLSGKGEVYSTTTIRRKAERGGDYNVSLITLEEGPRLMSRIESTEPELIQIGAPVTASINSETDEPFIIFNLSKEA